MAKMKLGKRGLSQVVTTLILLVVSVLLAGIVTYYATNITMTRTEQEDVSVVKAHVWVNSSGGAEAALVLQCLGGRDILMDKIAVRGVECSWSDCYVNRTSSSITSDLTYHQPVDSEGYNPSKTKSHWNVTIGSDIWWLDAATSDIDVPSSYSVIVYILNPPNIDLDDIGTTVSITVFTMQGQYIEEVNVEYGSA